MSCCCCLNCALEGNQHMAARGIDRKPTDEEAYLPPDKRPWTEYDMNGEKNRKPPFKACAPGLCLLFGPVCCVLEFQWCSHCGPDADTTCDVLCNCRTNRMKMFVCCGPQCDDVRCCELPCCCTCIAGRCCCCYRGEITAGAEVTCAECCECDCISNNCGSRYSGCQPPCREQGHASIWTSARAFPDLGHVSPNRCHPRTTPRLTSRRCVLQFAATARACSALRALPTACAAKKRCAMCMCMCGRHVYVHVRRRGLPPHTRAAAAPPDPKLPT